MRQPFLSVKDITFRYFEQSKDNILENASLDIGAGSVTVLLGNSGCGKSTLAAVCAGLYPENAGELLSGSVQLEGNDVTALTHAQRTTLLSMMFQNPDLQFCMETLRNEMIFCMENLSVPRDVMDEKIAQLAARLKIDALLDRKLSTLSGGEKQKAALCCLLLLDSKGILLDEPFANLDGPSARELIGLLKEQHDHANTTIIAIDHKLEHWLGLAQEIIILGQHGQVLQRGITPETLMHYKDLFRQEGLFYPEELLVFKKAAPAVPHLALTNLTINKGATSDYLLKDGNACFDKGKITALLGRSGCGKTSLFGAILKQKPYEGTITLDGVDIKSLRPRALFGNIGTVFQNPAHQFITTQVQEEVRQSLKIWYPKMTEPEGARTVLTLLEEFGLEGYRRFSPFMLSQGQQRRLAVLSVLAGNQGLLLMDEPTYGQDARTTTAMMAHLLALVKARGLTVIFTTHDKALACRYADKIYCMEGKALVEWKS